jgi:uncharacterized protein with NAD-binding domain and iron-sulfur cluster
VSGTTEPQRVAVLGGGAAALTAALALTDPAHQGRYRVTVYQMGWRLGGKGASGRNQDQGQRIEEHGIHVWFGFYDNAFRLLSACYREIAAAADQKPWSLPKCLGNAPPPEDNGAFYPHDDYFLHELHAGEWKPWHVRAPRNDRSPGDGQPLPVNLSFGYQKLHEMLASVAELRKKGWLAPASSTPLESAESLGQHGDGDGDRDDDDEGPRFASTLRDRRDPVGGQESVRPLELEHYLEGALDALVDPTLDDEVTEEGLDADSRFAWRIRFLAWSLRRARAALKLAHQARPKLESLRRIYFTVDTTAAITTGLYRDVLAPRATSFDHLDGVDLRAWLLKHGAGDNGANLEILKQNPTVRFVYNSAFSFVEGDHEKPSIAAGAALRGILRLFLTYKGAFAYRMASGMGDVVFSPMYEVLRRRGVTFKFFHRVDHLEVGDDPQGPGISAIVLGKQVNLLDESKGYDPLVPVKDFPAWPDRPRYEQIADGQALAEAVAGGLNLEDPEARWKEGPPVTLRVGDDFDKVVLGIPVAALKTLTKDLVAHDKVGERWKQMLDSVATTPTQAYQVWFRGTLRDLGWHQPAPIAGTFKDPVDTYIDMTPALQMEEARPFDVKTLAYFCGVMKTVDKETAGDSLARARRDAAHHLAECAPRFFPNLGTGAQFDWSMLAAASEGGSPTSQMAQQYVRANVLPSERYTLGLPGTTEARLRPEASGLHNLFLAGDWTRNPINLGCVEATVMSGLQAARALSGQPLEIVGEEDSYLWRCLGRGSGPTRALEALQSGAAEPEEGVVDGWTEGSLARLEEAVESYDTDAAASLCAALALHLDSSDQPFAEEDGLRVLKLLRSKRLFDRMEQVADALEGRRHASPQLRLYQAQALIERGQYNRALALLEPLVAKGASTPAELADEANGLLGRVYKQRYIDAPRPRSAKVQAALAESVAAYRRGYERLPAVNTWHGVNLLALLHLGNRDGVPLGKAAAAPELAQLAAAILRATQDRPLHEIEAWDYANVAEAYVAMEQLPHALKALRHYVVEANAFAIGGTLRQLEQIWDVGGRLGDPGKRLLTLLQAYQLQAQGGRIDLDGAHLQSAVDAARGLQKTFGKDSPLALKWYLDGLERCRLVARITRINGTAVGTGFLVRAGDFLGSPPDPEEMLLLTNAHVLGNDERGVAPEQARVGFEFPHDGVGKETFNVRQILRTSDRLDYALAALAPAIRGLRPFPLAGAPPPRPRPGDNSVERIYVIGHPLGGGLSFSLYDNHLLDLDDTLLHYYTATEPGSSGSPVLNQGWELVGLHHAGHRRMSRLHGSGYYRANEGILIDQIRAHSRQ